MVDETKVEECKCRYFVPEGRAVCISCKKTTDETLLEKYKKAFLELWDFCNERMDHDNNDYNCPDNHRDDDLCYACKCQGIERELLEKYKGLRGTSPL